MHTRTGPQTAANKEAATAAVAAGTETAAGHGWFSAKLHRNLRLPWLTFRTAGDVRWAVGGGRVRGVAGSGWTGVKPSLPSRCHRISPAHLPANPENFYQVKSFRRFLRKPISGSCYRMFTCCNSAINIVMRARKGV